MIKSMTGFGRSEYTDGKRNITVEIRSVNHRYSDITMKMPRRYSFVEEKLKSIVKKTAKRGKIDVMINIENMTENDVNIRLNTAIAKQYYDKLNELKQEIEISGDVTLPFIATLPDVLKSVPHIEDEEEIFSSLEIPMQQAVEYHEAMRIIEGKKMAEDIILHGDLILHYAKEIEEKSFEIVQKYKDKLTERIKELIGNTVEIPVDRIVLEAAIFADKSNVTEELVRLESHIGQLKNIIYNSEQPDGKKLDFIIQELNREANTIGSKSNDLGITNQVVEIKSEIEKMREQVQNIE